MQLPDKNIDKDRVRIPLNFSGVDFTVPTLDTSKLAIASIDFSMLIYKICTPSPTQSVIWDYPVALEAIEVYRKWLWLVRKYGGEYQALPPSIEIDEIWHHHILDTLKYSEDCKAVFGQFLHHYPYFGMRGHNDFLDLNSSFEITMMLYEKEYGEKMPSFLIEETV